MPSILRNADKPTDERIAAVILAAGQSNRLGSPKQLLDFKGKTFIENVIELILQAQLTPIEVVLGADWEKIQESIKSYEDKIHISINKNWRTGQSSSLRIAIEALENQCEGALFFLVDQPQIPVELVNNIIDEYLLHPSKIVAPYVNNQRGNPVLFDKSCFPKLKEGSGDQGGRFLFKEFEPKRVKWEDLRILIDVDTKEDYARLKESYEYE